MMVCLFVDDIEFRLSFLPIYRLFDDTDTRQQEVYDRSAHTCCSQSCTQTMRSSHWELLLLKNGLVQFLISWCYSWNVEGPMRLHHHELSLLRADKHKKFNLVHQTAFLCERVGSGGGTSQHLGNLLPWKPFFFLLPVSERTFLPTLSVGMC